MGPAGGRRLVLIVEDDADLAELANDVLCLEGFVAVSAASGRDALALLDAGLAPAVIVCDLMMPALDGFGFMAEHLRRPPPRAPVVGVSAFEGYLERAETAGFAATLAKPYQLEELVGMVTALAAGQPAPGRRGAVRRDESTRLAEIALLALDRPAPTPALDAFAARATRVFEVPIALVSIITADRQYWHAACGLPEDLAKARGSPRDMSFCTHAVAARSALVVQDAAENPYFVDNRFVRERGLRFYAGVPLLSRSGEPLGTFCLLDWTPRAFDRIELELLGVLAQRVVAELEQRERARRQGEPSVAFRHADAWDPELDVLCRRLLEDVARLEALRAAAHRWPLSVAVAAVPEVDARRATVAALGALPAAHFGRLGRARLGVVAPGQDAAALRAALAGACGPRAKVVAMDVDRPDAGAALLGAVEARLGDDGIAPRDEPGA
jgi:CheY-like chemotaxis protein